MRYPQCQLMVFCKAPVAGEVKTRLAKSYNRLGLDGDKIAANIHEFLALHCLRRVTENNLAPVELWCSPDKKHPFFQRCEKEFNVVLKEQGPGDLGERMSHAFDDVLSNNSCAVVIGTDCPSIDASFIERGILSLGNNKCSVIGPAEDGGYVLLGLSSNQPGIFLDIPWGSSHVYAETFRKFEGKVEELPIMWDVDRVEDVVRLLDESSGLGLDKMFADFLESIPIA